MTDTAVKNCAKVLLELGVPVVLALNVMDALRAGGGSVDTAGYGMKAKS